MFALTALFNLIFNFNHPNPLPKVSNAEHTISLRQIPTPITSPGLTSIPSITPTPTAVVIRPLSNSEKILNQINEYRKSSGLGFLSQNNTICSFAQTRSGEITRDFSHKGFEDRVNSHTLPFSYHFIAENIAETPNSDQVFDLWKNSPGHDANMRSSADFGCIGQNGNFYSLELWTP